MVFFFLSSFAKENNPKMDIHRVTLAHTPTSTKAYLCMEKCTNQACYGCVDYIISIPTSFNTLEGMYLHCMFGAPHHQFCM